MLEYTHENGVRYQLHCSALANWRKIPLRIKFYWKISISLLCLWSMSTVTNIRAQWLVSNRIEIYSHQMIFLFRILQKKMWRKTRRPISTGKHFGVDCNRNFGIGWHEANSNPSSQTFRGEKAFSEPETRLLKHLMHSLRPKFYLTLHSHAKSIMYPNGFTE